MKKFEVVNCGTKSIQFVDSESESELKGIDSYRKITLVAEYAFNRQDIVDAINNRAEYAKKTMRWGIAYYFESKEGIGLSLDAGEFCKHGDSGVEYSGESSDGMRNGNGIQNTCDYRKDISSILYNSHNMQKAIDWYLSIKN